MSAFLKPRVKELTHGTGTGSLQLLGAPSGYQTFLNAFGTNGNCYYAINTGTGIYEYGYGLINAASQLSRVLVIGGSNGPATSVSFPAGTKTVLCAIPPEACVNNDRLTLTNNSTTPDVRRGNVWVASNSSPTLITNFTGGITGQVITIVFTNGNTTLDFGTFLRLAGSADFTGTAEDTIQLIHYNGAWYEKARSVNA